MDTSTAHKLIELNRRFYDTFAAEFANSRSAFQPGIPRALAVLGHVDSVLDVGCGDGRLLEEMAATYGCEISGIEPGKSSAPDRLGDRLREFHKISVEREPLESRFDLVLCTEVIEHLHQPELAAKNMAAMCRGHLIVTVPSGPLRKTDEYMGHVRHYTVAELTELLSAA